MRRRHLAISVAALSLLLACGQATFADEGNLTRRLDSLSDPRGFYPIGGQPCPSDAAVKPGAALSTSGRPGAHAKACLTKVNSVIDALAKGSVTIIDTRAPSEFDKYRIPGSINMPAHAVKTKAFLKPHAFVLIDGNHTSAELENVCAELRRSGYPQASVVHGGLHSWQAHGGVIEGDMVAARALSFVRPMELVQEQLLKDWLVIDVSARKNPEIHKHFPGAISVPLNPSQKNDNALFSAIKGAAGKRILVVDEAGDSYMAVQGKLDARSRAVLYLEGGLRGYLRFQREQVAIWKQRDEPPKRKGCSA